MAPIAKKQRLKEDNDEISDMDMSEIKEDDEEKQPEWAKEQMILMKEIKSMLSEMTGLKQDVVHIKDDLNHVTLQAGMAQATAEEALEVVNNVDDRL